MLKVLNFILEICSQLPYTLWVWLPVFMKLHSIVYQPYIFYKNTAFFPLTDVRVICAKSFRSLTCEQAWQQKCETFLCSRCHLVKLMTFKKISVCLIFCTQKLILGYVVFEVLTMVVMKSSVFWDKRHVIHWKSSDVLEEHVASIFRVEE
jgi:hypothetical protein